ncbi:outer membrane beta-barrel protein [Roseovarius salis]|uniref:outer membrane protein n=1 Tax=Roseovarius salis TaxID=3376063 RepID=UPI0037CC042A
MKAAAIVFAFSLSTAGAAFAGSPAPAPAPTPAPTPPAPAAHDWTGFYAGGTVGYASAESTHCDGPGCGSFGLGPLPKPEPDGAMAGLTVGYNFQPSANLVWGFEADYSFGDLSETVPSTAVFGCGGGCRTEISGFGSIRARLGTPVGNRGALLPYVTAGAAFTDIEADLVGAGAGPGDSTETSAVAGLGLEYAAGPNWSVKLEYLHVFDTDSFVHDPTACAAPGCGVKDVNMDVVRIGANFHF